MARTSFEHTLSLYQWGAKLRISTGSPGSQPENGSSGSQAKSLSYRPRISLQADGISRLRQETQTRTSEAIAYIGADYPLIPRQFDLTLSAYGSSYSTATSSGSVLSSLVKSSSLSDGYGLAGGRYYPGSDNNSSFELAGGFAVRSTLVGHGVGPVLRAKGNIESVQFDDNNVGFGSFGIDERRFSYQDEVFRNDVARLGFISSFGIGGMNTLSLVGSAKRRDFFFTTDTSGAASKQERKELSLTIHNDIDYSIIPRVLLSNISLEITPKTITRKTPSANLSTIALQSLSGITSFLPSTTSISDLQFAGRIEYRLPETMFQTKSGSVTFGATYKEHSETNELTVSDLGTLPQASIKKFSESLGATSFASKETGVDLSGAFPFSYHDQTTVDFSSRLFQYDTPSKINVDDRDELYLRGKLGYRHAFSDALSVGAELRLAKVHLVYLYSSRSSQNNITQTIAFGSDAAYRARGFTNTVSGEVFANYTQYDFGSNGLEALAPPDYVIRGMTLRDSLLADISDGRLFGIFSPALLLRLEYRFYQQGAYNADAFSERPLLASQEVSSDALLQLSAYDPEAPIRLQIGARGYFVERKNAETIGLRSSLKPSEAISRIGPLVVITSDRAAPRGARLYASLWYAVATSESYVSHIKTVSSKLESRLVAEWIF